MWPADLHAAGWEPASEARRLRDGIQDILARLAPGGFWHALNNDPRGVKVVAGWLRDLIATNASTAAPAYEGECSCDNPNHGQCANCAAYQARVTAWKEAVSCQKPAST